MSKLSLQDVNILSLLQQDVSLTTQDVAKRLHISQSPCWRRISQLLKDGIISRRVAILNRERLGMEVVVFATISLSSLGQQNMKAFEKRVKVFSEVTECYTIAGTWDYMLKIVTKDIRHYEKFIREQLTMLPHIGEVHSHIAVTEIKNTTELPLDTQLQP